MKFLRIMYLFNVEKSFSLLNNATLIESDFSIFYLTRQIVGRYMPISDIR